MKKIASILLICVFLFNAIGYRWVFSMIEKRATENLETRIDAGNYSDNQLVEIKIPLQIPYYGDSKYESYYGEAELGGQHYRFVKRKISGDTLYLVCLAHTEKDKIIAAQNDFVKTVNDIQQNSQQQKQNQLSFLKLIMSEYLPQEKQAGVSAALSLSVKTPVFNSYLISQFEPSEIVQPPEHSLLS